MWSVLEKEAWSKPHKRIWSVNDRKSQKQSCVPPSETSQKVCCRCAGSRRSIWLAVYFLVRYDLPVIQWNFCGNTSIISGDIAFWVCNIICETPCIWTWLGQDVARLELAHCRLGHRGHLRSVTSVDLTFTSNHEFRASNRFARWWIRIAWFFSHLCYHDGYSNHIWASGRGFVTS